MAGVMMSLTELGLTRDQERVYRLLLRDPRAVVLPEERPIADELKALGLVDEFFAPVEPGEAVDLLVRRRVEQARRQLGGVASAWNVLQELDEERRSGRSVQMVEHLQDGPAVARRIRALLEGEPGEFLHLKALAFSEGTGCGDPGYRRMLARGLRSRTLFAAHSLDDPAQRDYARYWHALGDLHRVTVEPVRHLAVVNRSVVFVQAEPVSSNGGALQIHQPGVAAMLTDVLEGMWERARELDDPLLSPVEQRVLHALVRHDTDEAAARSAAMSVRKFRAHVADLKDRLGAGTRFQFALLAKERGWL